MRNVLGATADKHETLMVLMKFLWTFPSVPRIPEKEFFVPLISARFATLRK